MDDHSRPRARILGLVSRLNLDKLGPHLCVSSVWLCCPSHSRLTLSIIAHCPDTSIDCTDIFSMLIKINIAERPYTYGRPVITAPAAARRPRGRASASFLERSRRKRANAGQPAPTVRLLSAARFYGTIGSDRPSSNRIADCKTFIRRFESVRRLFKHMIASDRQRSPGGQTEGFRRPRAADRLRVPHRLIASDRQRSPRVGQM